MLKKLLLPLTLILTFGLVACGNGDSDGEGTLGDQVDYKIIGIEPGAGIMMATETALEEYENLADWSLSSSSSLAMAAELQKAYENEEPIIVTGWSPHWKFAKFDLKYLEDPKGIYGEAEEVHTFARKGLENDLPGAYMLLDNFNWEPADMEEVMIAIQEGADPKEAAVNWVEANEEKVAEWTDGAEEGNGETVTLTYVAWDSTIASTNVVGHVLESIGYEADLKQLDAGPMFAAVARGDADALLAGWLPLTHASYLEEYGDDMEDLGISLEGAKTGLVVPTYVDADSIEDL